MSWQGAASMKGSVIAGLFALAAIVLGFFLIFPSLLPSGLHMLDSRGDPDGSASIPRPVNLSPSAGEVVYGTNVDLEWTADANADSYVILITVSGSSIAALNLTSAINRYDLDGTLSGGTYLWTVQAIEDGTYGPSSKATQFTVKTTLDTPRLQSPADGSVHMNSVPTLRWSSVSDATGYRLQISGDAGFIDPVVDVRTTGTTYVPTFVMKDEAVYSWRVSAYRGEVWSDWSSARQFSHDDFLAAPRPLSPGSGSTIEGDAVNLTWSEVTGADGYRVQVSTSDSFASLLLSVEVTDEWYLIPTALDNGITYHWRVQAVNAVTISSWCAPSSFLVPEDRIPFSYNWTYDGRTWWLNSSASGLDYYHLRGLPRNYVYESYVMDGDPTVISVASQLKGMAVSAGYGGDLAQFILAFVQGVPYTEDLATTGQIEYPRYPVETLVDHGGDCEDKSALYASLMQCPIINVDAVMIKYTSTTGDSGHMAVGIAGSYSGVYYVYGGKSYFFCETTGVGWHVGEFPEQLDNYDAEVLPC